MSGTVDAGLVPSIEKDTTTTIPITSTTAGIKTSAAGSEVNQLLLMQTAIPSISAANKPATVLRPSSFPYQQQQLLTPSRLSLYIYNYN
jgi:hypothetical protein